MKITVKIFLLAAAVLLIAASCQKDENGNRITYYKNKTAVGYLFYKFENDSIAPITNFKMKIYCSCSGNGSLLPGKSHTDYVYSDNNGKYVCKLVKKINNDKVTYYKVTWGESLPLAFISIEWKKNNYFFRSDIENIEEVNIDTVFCYIKDK